VTADDAQPTTTAIGYHAAGSWPEVLAAVGGTVLVSTYQAGYVVAINAAPTHATGVSLSIHQIERAMGIAVGDGRVAVAGRDQIWRFAEPKGLAPRIDPPGTYDRVLLPRESRYTGPAQIHELAWGEPAAARGDAWWADLWAVNTQFNCLVGLDEQHHFVPRWRPPFIDATVAEDRCHLNGMAMRAGVPAYATVMARSNVDGGWRADRNTTGTILEVPSGEVVSTGLAMPHSPRWHDGALYVLNSGWGRLERVDLSDGGRASVAALPGYARGLAFAGDHAFVGLSRIRETSTFGGTPLAPYHDRLVCGVGVVDLRTGSTVATLSFDSRIEEIFDVQILPDTRAVSFGSTDANGREIWVLPA
jgi:uncharacterized protein (TIGR03032 family)